MRAMVLAAGRGERMRPLTDVTPKPLLEVAGERLIERHLKVLGEIGIRDVLINVSWLGEQIRATLGDGERFGVRLVYSEEPPGALETGGGIYRALAWLGAEPFLIVNADVWLEGLARWVLGTTLAAEDDASLMLVTTPPWKEQHDFAVREGRIHRASPTHTYAGVGVYRARLFQRVDAQEAAARPRFPLAPLLHAAADENCLAGVIHDGQWCDVGTPQRLSSLQAQRHVPSDRR